ncbi:MauE/DoxX family redox-associated membrane protein [Desulfoplanes sp. PS50]|jgi:uncharacterized membrane protein YphA (DoxX/SURF4 family)
METSRTPAIPITWGERFLALLFNRYIAFILRLYIGGIFIYASLSKISYPADFATNIANYMLVPYWAVNLLAVVMPWLELICGILLIAGVRSRAAIMIIGSLMFVFTLAIGINLWRGTAISCGCFHAVEDPMTMTTLMRDIMWLAMCGYIYFFDSWLQLDRVLMNRLRQAET